MQARVCKMHRAHLDAVRRDCYYVVIEVSKQGKK